MDEDLRQQLDRLVVKTELLTSRYSDAVRRIEVANQRIEDLKSLLARAEARNRELQTALESARMARTLAASSDDSARTRAVLSEMLRRIDRCIKQLTY